MDKLGQALAAIGFLLILALSSVQAAEMSDPMRPLRYQKPEPENPSQQGGEEEREKTDAWRFSGVVLSKNRSVAIVNGQPLQVGDMLEGYRVIEIAGDHVTFHGNERRVVLQRAGTGLKSKTAKEKGE